MLQDTQKLYGKKLAALDGDIGHIRDFFFDDQAWVIRYVVVDTGAWLTGRLVLLSPHAFGKLDQHEDALQVKLRKQQIEDSPSIAAHETVTRQFEDQYFRSYGWPVYWQGGEMWGMSGHPLGLVPQPRDPNLRRALEPRADRHLQGTRAVTGYHLETVDGRIGHVTGFRVDALSWAIRELVVETGVWHLGKQILISPDEVERISLVDKNIFVKLTKADIQRTSEGDLARQKAAQGMSTRG